MQVGADMRGRDLANAKVDVVIVTYRSETTVDACLASLDDVRSRVSVHVVENASGDGAADRAALWGADVIRNPTNDGFARGANAGAARGTGEFIMFLNPDARLTPGALSSMYASLADESVAVVGARLVHPDGREQRSFWPFPSARRMWAESVGLSRLVGEPGDGFVVGAALLVRRRAFEALGGFDESFWLYGEEADLCFRARKRGWRVVLASEAEVSHIGGASDAERSELVAEHFFRGSDRFVLKHRGRVALVSYRIAGLAGSAMRLAVLRFIAPDDPRVLMRRRQVQRTVSALTRYPTKVHAPDTETNRGLVVLSLEAWDTTWRRNQFLVRELMAADPSLRVLFVEPPADLLHDLRRRHWPSRVRALHPESIDGRLRRFQPWKWAPRVIWPGVDASLTRQVKRAVAKAGLVDPVLWVNDSTYAPLLRTVGWRTVYDITDDWLEAAAGPRERKRREARERHMLRAADEVVVCSPELARRRSDTRAVHLIPNAVDVDHFRRPVPRPDDLPSGKTAVYVGTLHDDRFDVSLVVATAEALPAVQFVLVGPDCLSDESRSRLLARANVHVLGARPYGDVPGYLQHADVIVVPHLINPFTESLDPIKAYECLVVDTPTVATAVPGFREVEGFAIADRASFASAVERALGVGASTRQSTVPSWTERAAEFGRVLAGTAELQAPEPPTRVVYLNHCAQSSGGELALARLLPALTNVQAHVILAEDGPLAERLRSGGATVEIMPMVDKARSLHRDAVRPSRLPFGAMAATAGYVVRLARRIRELDPDVVHTNSLKAAIYGTVAARLAGVPVIMHVRDRIAPDYLPMPAVRAIRLIARRMPDAVVANSTATLATLGETGRTSAVVPSPVIMHDPVIQEPLRDAQSGELTIGIIGRLAQWKGQDVFLRAFAAAFPEGGCRALVVGGALFGEHDFEREVRALAVSLGIDDRVTFTGHVEDVSEQLAQMHIVVHASVIPEPFGQVVVEAMAAGRAVVASRAGGPLEVVDDGVNGILVEPGDSDALAVVLRRLAGDPGIRARLGEQAVVRAQDFRPDRIAPHVLRLYRRVALAETR